MKTKVKILAGPNENQIGFIDGYIYQGPPDNNKPMAIVVLNTEIIMADLWHLRPVPPEREALMTKDEVFELAAILFRQVEQGRLMSINPADEKRLKYLMQLYAEYIS